jgi:RimJ/RimL family protein N-acetyltransferase
MLSAPMFHPIPEALLRTPRLQLRAWAAQDLAPFAALNADPVAMAHFPATLRRQESDALAERINALIQAQGWGFWALELRAPGAAPAFIGMLGLHRPQADLPFAPCVEIGWRLLRPYWHQGLAHEAAQAALRVGFDVLQLPEIVAFTALTNTRSQTLMQRLHMQRNLADDFEHPALAAGHPLRRHCLYRLPQQRWHASLAAAPA